MEKAKREYPSDMRVSYKLAWALRWKAHSEGDEASLYENAIRLYSEVSKGSSDPAMRENAVRELMYCYNAMGETDKALKCAKMTGKL